MSRPVAFPLTLSLLLHAVVLALLAFNFTFFNQPKEPLPQPKIIQARLVSMEQMPATRAQVKPVEAPPQPVAEPKPEPKPQPEPKPEPKPQPKKPEPLKPPLPELKKPEPIKPEQPVIPPPKPDLEKQKQIEKEKADAAKKIEQQKQEAERKRAEQEQQLEAQRKKQAEDQARKQREQQEKAELAKAMAAEDNAMAAERDQEAIASFQGKIAGDIERSWSRPPNARLGMQVTLSIQLLRSGEVVSVAIVKSSGNEAFDQSAVTAVRRVGKFSYLSEMPPRQFDQNFKPLVLIFNPTDLRQ